MELLGLRRGAWCDMSKREREAAAAARLRALSGRAALTAALTALTALPTFSVKSFQFGGGRSRNVLDRFAGGAYAAIFLRQQRGVKRACCRCWLHITGLRSPRNA